MGHADFSSFHSRRRDFKRDDDRINQEEYEEFTADYFDHYNFSPDQSFEDFEFEYEYYGHNEDDDDDFFDEYAYTSSQNDFSQKFHDHLKNQYNKQKTKNHHRRENFNPHNNAHANPFQPQSS